MHSAPLRVAVVGASDRTDVHLAGIAASDNARIVGIYDMDEELANLKAKRFDAAAIGAVEEILSDQAIDCVAVLTGPSTHAKHVERVLRSGKNVVCDTPIGIDLSETRNMVKVARQSGRALLPMHSRVYTQPMLELGRLLDRGAIGKVTRIEAHGRDGKALFDEAPSLLTDSTAGSLAALGYHPIYTLLSLGLRPAFLDAMRSTNDANVNLKTNATQEEQMVVLFQMEGGELATVTTDLSQQAGSAEEVLRVLGTEGELRVRSAGRANDTNDPRREQLLRIDAEGQTVLCEERSPEAEYTRMWDDYAEAVRRGITPLATVEQAVAAMSIVDSAHFSAQRGMRVNVRGIVDRQVKHGY
jgi:predicted dehydrogenase